MSIGASIHGTYDLATLKADVIFEATLVVEFRKEVGFATPQFSKTTPVHAEFRAGAFLRATLSAKGEASVQFVGRNLLLTAKSLEGVAKLDAEVYAKAAVTIVDRGVERKGFLYGDFNTRLHLAKPFSFNFDTTKLKPEGKPQIKWIVDPPKGTLGAGYSINGNEQRFAFFKK